MTTRTDVHSPKNLRPEDYELRGVFDLFPEADGDPFYAAFASQELHNATRALVDQGYRFASVHPHGQCDHCGARFRYAAYLTHEPSHTIVTVGEECLDNRFSLANRDFDRLRKAGKLNRERRRLAETREAFLEANPGLAEALETDHYIVSDIASRFRRYGTLSERQVALVFKIAHEEAERETRRQTREAEKAAARAAGVRVPEGRVQVEGTVRTVKFQDNAYGGAWKMVVAADEGWAVWSTIPASLPGAAEDLRGSRVRFTATITPSDDDPLFGFAKRPTKAEVLTSADAA